MKWVMTIKTSAAAEPAAETTSASIVSIVSIDKNFCFNSIGDPTIVRTKAALEHYSTHFQEMVDLKTKVPIFLDANVLLSYYGMASSEKSKLIKFLGKNLQQLHLTNQIQKEYLSNRVSVIKDDLFAPLNELGSDLRKGRDSAINGFSLSLNTSKKILEKDYPAIWEKLKAAESALEQAIDIEATVQELEASVKTTTSSYKEITFVDDMLDACSKLTVTPALSDTEVKFLEELFDGMQAKYEAARAAKKAGLSFPGQGDAKAKDYPYGDFFIFHEIMRYMKLNNTDAVFLTNEKSKGDWMDPSRMPHLHYIETAYANTGHVLFILNAEKPLQLSMENIYDSTDFSAFVMRHTMENLQKRFKQVLSDQGGLGIYCMNNAVRHVHKVVFVGDDSLINHSLREIIQSADQEMKERSLNSLTLAFVVNDPKASRRLMENIKNRRFDVSDNLGFAIIIASPSSMQSNDIDIFSDIKFNLFCWPTI